MSVPFLFDEMIPQLRLRRWKLKILHYTGLKSAHTLHTPHTPMQAFHMYSGMQDGGGLHTWLVVGPGSGPIVCRPGAWFVSWSYKEWVMLSLLFTMQPLSQLNIVEEIYN